MGRRREYSEGKIKRTKNYGDIDVLLSEFFNGDLLDLFVENWNNFMDKAKATGEGTKSRRQLAESTKRSLVNFNSGEEVKPLLGCCVLMALKRTKLQEQAFRLVKEEQKLEKHITWNK